MRSAVLASIVCVAFGCNVEMSDADKSEIAYHECKYFHDCAKTWKMIHREFPASLRAMEVPLKEGEEPFIEVNKDPWGREYELIRKERSIWVRSLGPDGKANTKDDVQYPLR